MDRAKEAGQNHGVGSLSVYYFFLSNFIILRRFWVCCLNLVTWMFLRFFVACYC